MSKAIASQNLANAELALIGGDLYKLSPEERLRYYKSVCETLKLNPLTKPFDYIFLNGKLTLYARKDATDQLRRVHQVSLKISSRETINDVYIVTAQAKLPNGREDESTGAVPIGNLKGDILANAMMKAETKAKRRVTLSICGLGMLDETEVEAIPQTERVIYPGGVYPEQPTELDGDPNAVYPYTIPFGKFKKRKLSEIPIDDLRDYILKCEARIAKDASKKPAEWEDFVKRAEAYIVEIENAPLDSNENGEC